jgi:predicted RNase H-like nuclease (RuvC/YqgF family)
MNKIQYINLLAIRGITELEGITIAEAVRQTGGEPTEKEMVKVNEESMKYFAEKWEEEKIENEILQKQIEKLKKRDEWLSCLEAAGVDNWEGYNDAIDISGCI